MYSSTCTPYVHHIAPFTTLRENQSCAHFFAFAYDVCIEWAEHEAREVMSSTGSSELLSTTQLSSTTAMDSWNKGLKAVQKALAAPPRKES